MTAYLRDAGLLPYLEQLGYHVVAYGCTTCMGNAGPLDEAIEDAVVKNDIVACAVLSGNRNFEARVHQSLKAQLPDEPAARRRVRARRHGAHRHRQGPDRHRQGRQARLPEGHLAERRRRSPRCSSSPTTPRSSAASTAISRERKALWDAIPESKGATFDYDPKSTYILEPPFFEGFGMHARHGQRRQRRARARHLRRLAHDRPHQPGRADQGRPHPPASGWPSTRRAR